MYEIETYIECFSRQSVSVFVVGLRLRLYWIVSVAVIMIDLCLFSPAAPLRVPNGRIAADHDEEELSSGDGDVYSSPVTDEAAGDCK